MTENRWLPVAERLAREVAARDYIHNIDAPHGGGDNRRRFSQVALVIALLFIGAFTSQVIPWVCGFRLVPEGHLRLANAVFWIDPRAERWTDEQLQGRLEFRREAIDLIEHTIATKVTFTYPYLSILSSHPSPIIDPGASSALLL